MSDRRRPKKILAFDWDTRTLRVVHALLGKRGVKIDRLLSVAIPKDVEPANPEQMGRHIRRTLEQEEISTRHAIVDIPRDQAFLNTLKLPCQAPDELPGMVKIQVAKELPFPEVEAVIDYVVGPSEPGDVSSEVLVAAVRHEVLEQYEATFSAAGLRLDRVGLRPYANRMVACALLRHAPPERVLIIDVGPRLTEISVLRDSFLSFSRAAEVLIPKDLGAEAPLSIFPDKPTEGQEDQARRPPETTSTPATGTDRVIRSLLVEVTRSIEAYRAVDAGAKLDHAVIMGDVGIEEALAEAIQQRLDVTTELYNPASTFGWQSEEGAAAGAFAAGLGLVLGHADEGALHFDFLHPKRTVSATRKRIKKARVVAAVVALFLLAGGVGFSGYYADDREERDALTRKIEELQADKKEKGKFLDLMDGIREFDAGQHVWVDVLHDVISVLPSNEYLVLDRINTNQKDGLVVLKTRASSREKAHGAIRSLESFRRDGRDKPRFNVVMGSQVEKSGKYPYSQDLRITILDDTGGAKKKKSKRSRG